jgi:hypothetical protein
MVPIIPLRVEHSPWSWPSTQGQPLSARSVARRRPSLPHRPAGYSIPAHAVGHGAEKSQTWCLSKNEQRRRVFRLAACLPAAARCVRARYRPLLTQAPASQTDTQKRCTSFPPAHRIPSRAPPTTTTAVSSTTLFYSSQALRHDSGRLS